MTVERSQSQGKVVVTHVSEAAVGATDSLDVTVDGEAAAKASSYSALEAAANDGEESKYYVAEDASAQAEGSATVLVAFDHFSERSASISGSETTNNSVLPSTVSTRRRVRSAPPNSSSWGRVTSSPGPPDGSVVARSMSASATSTPVARSDRPKSWGRNRGANSFDLWHRSFVCLGPGKKPAVVRSGRKPNIRP